MNAETGQRGVIIPSGGFQLVGTLFLARAAGPRPTAILLHGVPGIEKNYDLAHSLRMNGWNSLIFHFRGSWGSQGTYSLRNLPEDTLAAIEYLGRGVHPEVDPNRIVLIGHSLGGWAAVLAGARTSSVRAIAVYGCVCDTRTLQFPLSIISAEFTPWLQGISPYGFSRQWADLGPDHIPVEQVARLAPRPLLVIHSEKDEVVPIAQSRALFCRAEEPKELKIHATAGHSFTWHRTWLIDQLLKWLDRPTI